MLLLGEVVEAWRGGPEGVKVVGGGGVVAPQVPDPQIWPSSSDGGAAAHLQEGRRASWPGCGRGRRWEKKEKEMVGPTFGGGNGGPPEMEGGRGNLEGYAKWRLV
jgi:hypothetical protein